MDNNSNKTQILYSASLMSKRLLDIGFSLFKNSIGVEIQKYHRLIIEGLQNNSVDVQVISFHPCLSMVENLEANEIEDGISFKYLTSKKSHFAHLDIIKQSYRATKEYIKNNNCSCLICDVLNYSVSLGSVLAAKKMKVKTIGIITDFPEGSHPKGSIKIPLIWRLIKKLDGYVILTKQMLEKLNSKKKYAILEGQADIKEISKSTSKEQRYNEFTCLYAGSIHERYGIGNLVKGFLKADIPNSKLIVYGNGDYVDELKKVEDNRIDYRGLCPNEVILKEEKKATLLINPRPTNDSYTLYSFPSKTIEYMASGTAVVTTKLPGIPDEYFNYIYYFDGFDEDSIARKIIELASFDRNALFQTGEKAREFVLNEKNNTVQSKKILDLISRL